MLDCLMALIKAKTELDAAKESCDHSWGPYLHDQIDQLKAELKTELTALIDERIAKATE